MSDGPSRAPTVERLRHDLCTPLNHVLGYSEMLLEDAEPLEGHAELRVGMGIVQSLGRQALEVILRTLPSQPGRKVASLGQLRAEVTPLASSLVEHGRALCAEAVGLSDPQARADLGKIQSAAEGLLRMLQSLGDEASVEESGPRVLPAALVTSGPPGRVMVVDDNPLNRDLLKRKVEALGHQVVVAENGRVALQLLAAHPVDLILLDILMPEMDGFQVLAALKADRVLRATPVLVLSSLHQTSGAVRCIEMGAEDFLPKPVEDVLLRARINSSLEKKRLRDQEVQYLEEIEAERRRADDLLHVILPKEIATELKQTNRVEPRRLEQVAVLFCDIVGFTPYCEATAPQEVLRQLQVIVERFEEVALAHAVQKIKTIGDAFMAAAGLMRPLDNPAHHAVRCAAEMLAEGKRVAPQWDLRIGVHVGPVVAGVLGKRQYSFDLWGDTVNTAARVESHGVPGAVTVSRAAWDQLAGQWPGESLGITRVKGKGEMELFRIAPLRDL